MMSCILRLYLALSGSPGAGTDVSAGSAPARAQTADPDALYAARDDLAKAREAAGDLDRATAQEPEGLRSRLEAWPRALLAGRHAPTAERKALLEEGIEAGRSAASSRAEAAGGLLLDRGEHGRAGRVVRAASGSEVPRRHQGNLLTVLKLDPAFQKGSADRALGRWYFKVPGLFGGLEAEVRGAPAQVTDLRRQQHGFSLFPRRNTARPGDEGRRARGAAASASTPRSMRTGHPKIGSSRRRRASSSPPSASALPVARRAKVGPARRSAEREGGIPAQP